MRTILLLALATFLSVPTALADAPPQTPLEDGDGDGDMELGPLCLWGWSETCTITAAECFQPYRRWFGIHCI
jgi:hypothetical protein